VKGVRIAGDGGGWVNGGYAKQPGRDMVQQSVTDAQCFGGNALSFNRLCAHPTSHPPLTLNARALSKGIDRLKDPLNIGWSRKGI
jgi:hypothetical protein